MTSPLSRDSLINVEKVKSLGAEHSPNQLFGFLRSAPSFVTSRMVFLVARCRRPLTDLHR